MDRDELLARIKTRLAKAHGPRLKGVVLYGSEARGEAEPDSDIDVLVVLDGPFHYWEALDRNIDALYDLVLELGRPISAKPVETQVYHASEWPLYQAARREGIFV